MIRFILLYSLLGCAAVFAQSDDTAQLFRATKPGQRPQEKVRQEVIMKHSYGMGSDFKYGDNSLGDFDSQHSEFGYIVSPAVAENIYFRTGIGWERFGFSVPTRAPVPNTLQSLCVPVGVDARLSETWSLRAEIRPGIYSDFQDVSDSDINVPGLLGASWTMNEKTRWFFGLTVNPWSSLPVMPGAGVRWGFAEQWTLNLAFPNPRVEYQPADKWKVFAGADWVSGSFRVAEDFGTRQGNRNLNDAIVSYREIRAGVGGQYQMNPGMGLELEAGYILSRRVEYDRANELMTGTAAPYVQLGLSARF